jgi:hypothetical protein
MPVFSGVVYQHAAAEDSPKDDCDLDYRPMEEEDTDLTEEEAISLVEERVKWTLSSTRSFGPPRRMRQR